ncbi:MAG: FecR domain-containing protein [Sphingobium sp.]
MLPQRSTRMPAGLSPAEAASYWLVRLDGGPLATAEEAEFQQWIAKSDAHAEAFARVQAAWGVFDQPEAGEDTHLLALRKAALETGGQADRRRWIGAWIGAAAAMAACLIGAALLKPLLWPPESQSGQQGAQIAANGQDSTRTASYATGRGETRRVPLPDGSFVTLDTDSQVDIAYGDTARGLHLVRGRALFEVARNKTWPFVVTIGDRQVTALGTMFQLRLDSRRMKILLVEGKVVVDDIAPQRGNAPPIAPTFLQPGQQLTASIGAGQQIATADIDRELFWRSGFIEFDNVRIADAIAEMNRYSERQLIVRDPAVSATRISGVFRTGDPDHFAALAAELLPVRGVAAGNGRIELVVRP